MGCCFGKEKSKGKDDHSKSEELTSGEHFGSNPDSNRPLTPGQTAYPQEGSYTGPHPRPSAPTTDSAYPSAPGYYYGPAPAHYDAGARFGSPGDAPASIPPPPPGVMPNSAQQVAAQGQEVPPPRKKSEGFMEGSGSGGTTFW